MIQVQLRRWHCIWRLMSSLCFVFEGCLLGELIDHSACVCDLSFSPTGMLRLLSASVDGSLKLWDMEDDGNLQKTLCTRSKAVFGCCWSPSGRMIASVGDYRSVNIWSCDSCWSCLLEVTFRQISFAIVWGNWSFSLWIFEFFIVNLC